LDLALGGKQASLSWHLAYSYVDATYRSSFDVSATSNSTADADGNITVRPGDRIPLVPRHTGRLTLDYDVTPQLDLGANLIVAAGSFLHGDENNANHAGGTNAQGAYISADRLRMDSRLRRAQPAGHLACQQARGSLRSHRQRREPALCHRGIPDQRQLQPERQFPRRSGDLDQ
jgi:hypothetical protein